MRRLAALLAFAALSGCASGYSTFYTPVPASAGLATERYAGEPQVVASSGDPSTDVDIMYTRGLGPVGYADFNGPMQSMAGAIAQAKNIGAQYVVAARQYTGTVSGAIPITTLQPQTTYTSGTVSATGSGGYATGTYNGTSTTYSSQTSYIPYSVTRYEQRAIFFAPLARQGLGLRVKEIGPADAQRLGTAKGMMISAIRRGSPAFDADLLPGDVLESINGQVVYDQATMAQRVQAAYGAVAQVTVMRAGKTLQKIIHLPPGGIWN